MNKLLYLFVFWGFFIFSACNSEDDKELRLLSEAEKLLEYDPETSLAYMERISDPENLSSPLEANYYLLHSRIKLANGLSLYQDTVLSFSIDYFQKNKDYLKAAWSYYYRNKAFYDTYREEGNSEKALLDCLEARKYATKIEDNHFLLGRIYYDMGDIYDAKLYYEEALANYKLAQHHFSEDKRTEDIVFCFGKLGSLYYKLQKPDSALFYQKQALDYMFAVNDSSSNHLHIISLLYKNIASSFRKLGNPGLQKEYLLEAYRILPDKKGQDANIILSQIALAYIQLNKPDSAVYYGEKYVASENETQKEKVLRLHHQFTLYKALKKYDLALQHLEQFAVAQNNIFNEEMSSSILEVQQKYDRQVLQNQYNEILVQRLYLVIAVILVILLGVVASWFFIHKIRKKEIQLSEAEQAIQSFTELLHNQDRKNEKLTALLIDKLDLTRKVAQMNVVSTTNTKEFVKQYHKIFGKDLLEEINWDNIYPVINDLYNGFVSKIESNFPGLAPKDVQLCCFVRAGFRTEEIAVLLNYTQSSVRVKKTRISRKMGFLDNDSFITYLTTL